MVGRYSKQREEGESMTGGINKRQWVAGSTGQIFTTVLPLISTKGSVTAKERRGRETKEKSCFMPVLALC